MKHFGIAALATLALASTAAAQTTVAPSKWGPSDEIGAANYITPQRVAEAAKLVKTGKTYSLGIIVDSKTPACPPRSCSVSIVQPGQVGSAQGLGPTHTPTMTTSSTAGSASAPRSTGLATSASATSTTTATSGPTLPRSTG